MSLRVLGVLYIIKDKALTFFYQACLQLIHTVGVGIPGLLINIVRFFERNHMDMGV